ncbi:hypothetical protein [Ferirhizobium litorale]|uniref:Uncharacterized protein n=1 Tax=Ferirhizobium litorale TaxID=2927786 RepID=A0AAE3U0M1_9HYPH|nr:hypothetical protein [Fererhizobium litorale]MDI7920712.1 hypothetical protein [Fererhizobium litorale]
MSDEDIKFYILRLALGHNAEIAISHEEYSALKKSRAILREISSLEEKFFSVCEHYQEVEEYIFSSTLRHMIFTFERAADIHSIGAGFGRRTASFLSSVRLYQDTLITHIGEISESTIPKQAISRRLSKEYDDNLAYRVMEALRNHSQHRAFPVHSSKYNRKWNENRTEMTFSSMFYFEVSRIEGDKKFKKGVKDELASLDIAFDLKDGVRRYFASICRIHSAAREEFEKFRAAAVNCVTAAQEKWASAHDDDFTGVAACAVRNGVLVKGHKVVYIGPEQDEYRVSLEKRTRGILNMDLRTIAF